MRLIDADAFCERQKKRCSGEPIIGTCTINNMYLRDELAAASTIDAVEVVRCKDCKWYAHDGDYAFCDNYTSLMDHVGDETFCSYGERRIND